MDATTTTLKPFLATLAGEVVRPAPVWLMRQAGRYLAEYRALRAGAPDFLRFCLDPDLTTEATLQPIRRYGFDAAILFSDIFVPPYALGHGVRFETGEGPVVDRVTGIAQVEALDLGRARDAWAPVMETVRRLRAALPPRVALIGFAGAPFTVAAYMVEGGGSRDFAAARLMALSSSAPASRRSVPARIPCCSGSSPMCSGSSRPKFWLCKGALIRGHSTAAVAAVI